MLIVAVVLATVLRISGQEPKFEVASIRPNTSDSVTISGSNVVLKGRYTVINYPIRLLIADAFGMDARDQVIGGPPWLNSAKYDITATTEVLAPPRAQFRSMLQTLLKERFNLVAHIETKEVDVYDLVIARSDGQLGSGLRRSTVNCDVLAASGKRRCGWSASGLHHTATAQPLQALLVQLSSSVDRRIVDRTGLTGRFDWEMQISSPNDPTGPSVFTALQEQLGLRLVPSRSSIDVVVIDHITQPTDN